MLYQTGQSESPAPRRPRRETVHHRHARPGLGVGALPGFGADRQHHHGAEVRRRGHRLRDQPGRPGDRGARSVAAEGVPQGHEDEEGSQERAHLLRTVQMGWTTYYA